MSFNDIYLTGNMLKAATSQQVAQAEAALHSRFPAGYRDYVTTLGAGYLNGRVRVIPPDEIIGQTEDFRDRLHWLFGDSEGDVELFSVIKTGLDIMPPKRLFACILIVDAGDGHEIIYHPDAPDEIFLLPHEQDGIYFIGQTLEEACTAFLHDETFGHGVQALVRNGQRVHDSILYFEPDPARIGLDGITFTLISGISYETVRADLVDIAMNIAGDALLVRQSYVQNEDAEVEHLHLFVKEYCGNVHIDNRQAQEGGPLTVSVSYKRDRSSESFQWIISFFRRRSQRFANFYIDRDGSWIHV